MVVTSLASSAHCPPRQGRQRHSLGCLLFSNSCVQGVLLGAPGTLFLLSHTPCADAALRNVTIDDEYGDSLSKVLPTFLPTTPGVWQGAECTGCSLTPDPARMFSDTYKAATYRKDEGIDPVEFSFQFTGIAVYVFLTLANQVRHPLDNITTLTEVNFTIDDGPPRFFRHEDRDAPGYIFQFPAFVEENLEHREHTFRGRISGPQYHIYLNFDYAIYTQDDTLITEGEGPTSVPTTTSTISSFTTYATSSFTTSLATAAFTSSVTSTTSTASATTTSSAPASVRSNTAGRIAGGVVGGLAFAAFVFAFLFIRQRARRGSRTSLGYSDTGGGRRTAGGRIRRSPRREYPNPELFILNHLHDTRHAGTGAFTGNRHITPFTSSGGARSNGNIGLNYVSYVPPQPVRKDRIGGSDGTTDGTAPSYLTHTERVQQLPVYTSNEAPAPNRPHLRSQANQGAFGEGSGNGSSTSGNRYAGMEESVYAATGVRLDAMNALAAAAGARAFTPSGRTNFDAQMQALQDSICVLLTNLQSERERLAAGGMSAEDMQRDDGLRRRAEALRLLAEEMAMLQGRSREVPLEDREDHDGERRGSSTTLPGYESIIEMI